MGKWLYNQIGSLFLPLLLVGSYQVGYTRSHPNTEVKMLRACSVPLCSHRRERQVIYLFYFYYNKYKYKYKYNTIQTQTQYKLNTFIDEYMMSIYTEDMLRLCHFSRHSIFYSFFFISVHPTSFILRGFMVQLVITSLLRSEGPRFEPGWNHFYARYNAYTAPFCALLPPTHHDYPFLTLSSVGSYQVGYTRSHPNTEVKMLRACSVPLCSHRRERQVIYLFNFFRNINTIIIQI